MALKIGSKIMEMRKRKGMTQEQLADTLGVSAPAVSKWETDSSYPDITLLCPLARALDTDVDTLLAFEENLTEERLGECMVGITALGREGKIRDAEAELDRLLHLYPSDIRLKFNAVIMLTFLEMNVPERNEEDTARWAQRKKELIRAVYDDGNPAFYMSSISMLVSMALAEGDLEQAESLMKETLTNTADFTALWVRLYIQKGEKDKALATAQRQLYKLTGEMKTCLISMLRQDMVADIDQRLEICEVIRTMDEMFRVGAGYDSGLFAEIFLEAGRKEECLTHLEQLVDGLLRPMESPNPLLFAPAITVSTEQPAATEEMRMTILHGLEKDDCFEELRSEERFQELIRRLKDSLQSLDGSGQSGAEVSARA